MSKFYILTLLSISVFHLNASAQLKCSSFVSNLDNNFSNLEFRVDQPRELRRWRGGIRRSLGASFIKINAVSTQDLATQMLKDRESFDLVFKADKGLFTDLGIFELLDTHPNILSLDAGRDTSVHVAALNSGSYVVYLKHKAPHGEELSVIGSQMRTGAVVKWIKNNHPNEFSALIAAKKDQNPLELSLGRADVRSYGSGLVIDSLHKLSKLHALLGNKDLGLALELTTLQNKLKKLNPNRAYSIEEVLAFYNLTKKEIGFWGDEDNVRMLTFFGLLAEIQPKFVKELFDDSSSFWGSESDQLAIFMGIASRIKLDKVSGVLPEGAVSLTTLEKYLEAHKALYKLAFAETGFWVDNSMYTYVSAAISGKSSKFDIQDLEKSARYINKNAAGDIDGPLLVYASTNQSRTVQQTVEDFNHFRKLTKDDNVALSLLASSHLKGQSVAKVTKLFETASDKGEHIDSEELSQLLLAGMKAGLRPGQSVAMLNEASAYTGGKLDEAELMPFAESILGNYTEQDTSIGSDIARSLREQIAEEVRQATTMNLIITINAINTINIVNSSR